MGHFDKFSVWSQKSCGNLKLRLQVDILRDSHKPFKDPMLVSPMKSGLPPRLPSFTTENTNNSTNDGMDIE
jgi:hypothetical protein